MPKSLFRGDAVNGDAVEFSVQMPLGVPQIEGLLHSHPQAGAVAAEASQPQRHLRRHRRAGGHDGVKRLARYAKLARRFAHGEPKFRQHDIAE